MSASQKKPTKLDPKTPWRAYVKQRHLKLSKAREEVVEAFLAMKGHVDLDQLHAQVRKRNPSIGLATVYRAVKLMEDAGIAEARQFAKRNVSYEVAFGREHHDHLICESCGWIVEFADADVERIQEETATVHGFVLLRHRHELFGLCPGCRPVDAVVLEARQGAHSMETGNKVR